MSARSKEELQTLYFELGDALARNGQLPEAADAYAVAMYYSRRSGNRALADLCREQVLACHPNHVATRDENAPLFFAQLLMRYPAEEAQRKLESLHAQVDPAKQMAAWTVPLTSESASMGSIGVMASSEPAPKANPTPPSQRERVTARESKGSTRRTASPVAPAAVGALDLPEYHPSSERSDASLASLLASPVNPASAPHRGPVQGGPAQGGWPSAPHGGLEHHHGYSGHSVGASAARGRITEDFEMPPASERRPRVIRREYDRGMTWLNPVAAIAAMAGVVAIGFFAYKLYPEVSKIEYKRAGSMVDYAVKDAMACYQQVQSMYGHATRDVVAPAVSPPETGEFDARKSVSTSMPAAIPSVSRIEPTTMTTRQPTAAANLPVTEGMVVPAPPRELPPIATELGPLPQANTTERSVRESDELTIKPTAGGPR